VDLSTDIIAAAGWEKMRIGVLGTGVVGKTLATRLVKLGHDVRMGSRTAGVEKAKAWIEEAGGKSSETPNLNVHVFR